MYNDSPLGTSRDVIGLLTAIMVMEHGGSFKLKNSEPRSAFSDPRPSFLRMMPEVSLMQACPVQSTGNHTTGDPLSVGTWYERTGKLLELWKRRKFTFLEF